MKFMRSPQRPSRPGGSRGPICDVGTWVPACAGTTSPSLACAGTTIPSLARAGTTIGFTGTTPGRPLLHWHDSQSGLSIEQNFGASGSCTAYDFGADALMLDARLEACPEVMPPAPAIAPAPAMLPTPPDADTAFNSPPWPVDFSAEVAASVRR